MLVESMPAQDRLVTDMPAQDGLVVDKLALDKLVEGMPAQPRLGLLQEGQPEDGKTQGPEDSHEERLFGLERNEDQTGKVVEDEKGLYKKAESGEELRIGMDPLRGSVTDRERPNVSGPVRSIKMYSYAQCTVQERLVYYGDVPCLAHMEQGSGPLHS